MQAAERYVNERLDHLGMVAGVCREIGLAAWLDAQDTANCDFMHILAMPVNHIVAVPASGR